MATMKILAIETSCDETGLAIVEASGGLSAPKFKVLKNIVASQIKIHRPFGGVVPNLAKREHLKNLPILYKKLLKPKTYHLKPDLIAVTVGPGLEPALWTGINFAKELRETLISADRNADKRGCIGVHQRKHRRKSAQPQLIGVNHMEGHLYSFLLPQKTSFKLQVPNFKNIFPAIALIVSGGHTILLKLDSFSKWKRLGETRDDAAGEAFDKVARLLGLPYPGGPEIEKLARAGNPAAIKFPRPMIHDKNYDFSFSGLKTSALYYLRDHPDADKKDVAASFQKAAVDVLVAKTIRAAKEYSAKDGSACLRRQASGGKAIKSIILSGGVAANKALRKALSVKCQVSGVRFFVPDFKYNLDNAAMIAAAGYMTHLRKKKYKLEARGDMEI